MRDIAILALDSVLDSALAVTLDVLRAANTIERATKREPSFRSRVLGDQGPDVTTGSGYRRSIDGVMRSSGKLDIVVVPAVEISAPDAIDAVLERADVVRAIDWLRSAHARGALVLASCSSTFLLARAGLLDGTPATTSWYLAPRFRQRFPTVDLREDAVVVASDRVVTAGAAFSHVDLMLWLVRRVGGPNLAENVARFLVLDDRTSQSRYMTLDFLGARSAEVGRAERFMRENLSRPLTLADVARAAKTSARTMARRFETAVGMSPLRFLRRVRVERAEHLLQTTQHSVEEVARQVGYSDALTLRRLLRKELGKNPREIRSSFRGSKRVSRA